MKIARDKLAHFIYSAWGAAFIAVFFISVFSLGKEIGALLGFLTMIGIGLYKEFIHDRLRGKGNFEWMDLIADFLGSMIGFIFIMMYYC
jgi:uncharacterized protein YfiM (DUF2279 family)